MKYRLFSRLLIANLLLVILIIVGCSGGSSEKAQSGKSVSRIILDSDKGVVTDFGDQAEPAVAYDTTTQTYLTVFTSVNGSSGITEIFGAVCAGYPKAGKSNETPPTYAFNNYTSAILDAGMTCGDKFQISDVSASGNKSQPKVAYDRDSKKYLVAWTDSRNGTYSLIYGQYVKTNPAFKTDHTTLNGVLDGVNFPISEYQAGIYISQSQPEVIYNGVTQKFVIAWVDTSTVDSNVMKGMSAAQNPKWHVNDLIQLPQVDTTKITDISVARTSGGGTFLKDIDYEIDPVTADIKIRANGALVNTTTSLTVSYTLKSGFTSSQVKVPLWAVGDQVDIPNSSGSALFNLSTDVLYLIMDAGVYNGGKVEVVNASIANGSSIESNIKVTLSNAGTESSAVNTSNPITAYRTQNSFVFPSVKGAKCSNAIGPTLFIPTSMADNNLIRSAELSATTTTPTNYQNVSRLGQTSDLADDAAGTISAKWSVQTRETRPKIAYNQSTGENYFSWSGLNVNVDLGIKWSVNEDKVSCGYGSVFTATDSDSGKTKIKLRRNALNLITDFTFGTGTASYPSLATDPNTNKLMLVWEEDQSIIGQLLDLTGFTQYGPRILVSAKSTDPAVNDPRTSPVVAFDNVNQRFFTVWEDARNRSSNISNIDIYGQFIDNNGNLSGGNTLVSVASGNQLAPALAFGDVNYRKFFINWKDGSNPADANISGQLHEYSLGPQLALYTKDASGTLTPLLNGALDFGSINVGSMVDKTLVLRNDGNSQLIVNSITEPDSPYSFLTPKPVSINPNTSYDLGLRFAPYAAGSYADPSKNFKISIDSTGGKAVVYFSAAGTGFNPLNITTSSLPDASTGTNYYMPIVGSGGVYPYLWELNCAPINGAALPKNTLPAGLTFNTQTGVIIGVPTGVIGEYVVTIKLTDNSSQALSVTSSYRLKIGNLSIATSSLKTWGLLQNYSGAGQTLQVSTNGQVSTDLNAYKWEQVILGSLPNGMHFSFASGYDTVGSNPSTWTGGRLIGTPTVSGSFTFALLATDRTNASLFAQKEFTLTINPNPTILTTSLPVGIIGKPYSYAISMTGGTAPFTWGIASGTSMPAGLSFSNGVISGIPTASNTANSAKIEIVLTDATGFRTSKQLSLNINNALDITTSTDASNKWSATNPNWKPYRRNGWFLLLFYF